jgi:hypothetical protein
MVGKSDKLHNINGPENSIVPNKSKLNELTIVLALIVDVPAIFLSAD